MLIGAEFVNVKFHMCNWWFEFLYDCLCVCRTFLAWFYY